MRYHACLVQGGLSMKNFALMLLMLCIAQLPFNSARATDGIIIQEALQAVAERTNDAVLVRSAARLARICTNDGINATLMEKGCRVLRLSLFSGNDDAAIRRLVRGMMAEEGVAIGHDMNLGAQQVLAPILGRMSSRRALATSLKQLDRPRQTLPIAMNQYAGIEPEPEGMSNQRQGVFTTLSYGDSTWDHSGLDQAFEYDKWSILMGVDTFINPNLLLGLALSLRHEEGSIAADPNWSHIDMGKTELEQFGLSLFTTWTVANEWVIEGMLNASIDQHFQQRRIQFDVLTRTGPESFDGRANASPDGNSMLLFLALGKTWQIGEATRLSGKLSGQWSQTDIGAYSEVSANIAVPIPYLVKVQARSIQSELYSVHFQLDHSFSTTSGVFSPFLRLQWMYENAMDADPIYMQFLVDPLHEDHNVLSVEADRSFGQLSAGVNWVLAHNKQLFIQRSTLVEHDDIKEDTWVIGGRIQF